MSVKYLRDHELSFNKESQIAGVSYYPNHLISVEGAEVRGLDDQFRLVHKLFDVFVKKKN